MKSSIFYLLVVVFLIHSHGQSQSVIDYRLTHQPNSSNVSITISFAPIKAAEINLVIPQSAPGTYEITSYISYVSSVQARTTNGKTLAGVKGIGSFFNFPEEDVEVSVLSYSVDIEKMEDELLGSFASSKMRSDYLGILGYSVFGFLEGYEENPIRLTITTRSDWPIFSTLKPSTNRNLGNDSFQLENFAALADAQYLLGEGVKILEVKETPIPLFIAAYSEAKINMAEIGRRASVSLIGLSDYYGYVPMPHYSVCYEFLIPKSPRHDYGFSMEHLNSMTASLDVSRAINAFRPDARIGGLVHHIGHSWVPLRSYGKGYRPFNWQVAPLIETVWLNEGFIWYIAFYHVLGNRNIINNFRNIIDQAPEYIRKMPLRELSLLGSSQYSKDFRIGRNLYARGALLAHDLDKLIIEKTGGDKSIKDALLALLQWTEKNQRAFEYDEIEQIIREAVNVDISKVWIRWQGAYD